MLVLSLPFSPYSFLKSRIQTGQTKLLIPFPEMLNAAHYANISSTAMLLSSLSCT